MKKSRVDKILVSLGLGSRRIIKQLVKEKRIKVNNETINDSSFLIDPDNDVILFDDEILEYSEYHYFMLNKPAGYISATEGKGPTVMDLLDVPYKNMFPCGRLDKDTEGLLIITDDGPLTHKLLSPKHRVEKEYYVRLELPFDQSYISIFKEGITTEDGVSFLPSELIQVGEFECNIIVHEGKYHEIKRLFKHVGNKVTYLKRIRMKNLWLDYELPLGQYRELTKEEIDGLKE